MKMVAVIAQLVEQPPCKRQVVGSSPTRGSIFVLYKYIRVYDTMGIERYYI